MFVPKMGIQLCRFSEPSMLLTTSLRRLQNSVAFTHRYIQHAERGTIYHEGESGLWGSGHITAKV